MNHISFLYNPQLVDWLRRRDEPDALTRRYHVLGTLEGSSRVTPSEASHSPRR